jgi:uncharacterized surface protein with fasciclin (FAS1) repeats
VPNDNAFGKLGDWGTPKYDKAAVEAILKYHIFKGTVEMPNIEKGEFIWRATMLDEGQYSSITGGQRLMLTKMPSDEVVITSGFATRGTVVVEDLAFDKGLVQVIDSVMRVPDNLEATAANAYKDLTAFVGALHATDLMDELAKQKDVTIFAPRNAAFQQLGTALEDMDKEKLKRILRYHIVPNGVSHVWELKHDSTLETADNGNKVAITRHTNFIFLNSAEIIQPDILLSNGVVHMIDNVLNPDKSDARPDLSGTRTQAPAFSPVGSTETGTAVPIPFASDVPCTVSCPAAGATGGAGSGGGNAESTKSKNAGPAAARCTGLAGAGVGVGLALGAIMVGL